ncbi:MAG: hypothetical protein HY043_16455 [Verrucomicrobia bacterium]|nr:hypothetical protein [Verrucomicrobiota bacterium]
MKVNQTSRGRASKKELRMVTFFFLFFTYLQKVEGAGVTIITHGLDGNVSDWIIPMAEAIGHSGRIPNQDFSCFEFHWIWNGTNYIPQSTFLKGSLPTNSSSGEILVKLDWSQLADGKYSTTQLAESITQAMLKLDFVPELSGHSVVELPIHLIGHSRGGSLVAEICRLLGARGIWIDQMTTLDPHPLNNDGFDGSCGLICDSIVIDGPVRPYENVLFADNYYQRLAAFVYGNNVPGAYNRKLLSLYQGYYTSNPLDPWYWHDYHSNVHLWYHATLDFTSPKTTDTQAFIDDSGRDAWFTSTEARGTRAGHFYSRLGGGNRLRDVQPAGLGSDRIRDGYNQRWDLGAGIGANRYALPDNDGSWPNPIQVKLLTHTFFTVTNVHTLAEIKVVPAIQEDSVVASFTYQSGTTNAQQTRVSFFLDRDTNPYNKNEIRLTDVDLSRTGVNAIASSNVVLKIDARRVPSGLYRIAGEISVGSRVRYLYGAEWLEVFPQLLISQLVLDSNAPRRWRLKATGIQQLTVALERSADLKSWIQLGSRVLAGGTDELNGAAEFIDETAPSTGAFYRALYTR